MNPTPQGKIDNLEDLLRYARKFERDAALRYSELADQMEVFNNPELANLFRKMAVIEQMHVDDVSALCGELGVEEEDIAKTRWVGLETSEAPDYSEIHYQALPAHMIRLAMGFEQKNAEFYANLAKGTSNDKVREAAKRLQAEEEMHLRELETWLKRYPESDPDWDYDMDPPMELE